MPSSSAPARGDRRIATAAVLLGLVVSAFEGTVVTSAMPTIARELSGLALYGWVFSAFLVASMIGVLVSGKLADAFGRKPVFTAGMVVFLAGSALCGAAGSIGALVLFRVVQGLGAGAIQPIAMTITSDLYTLEERARIQALFTGAWGTANVVGPPIGGFLVTHFGWRSVFLVNVPVGALAVVLLLVAYRDPDHAKVNALGLRGAVLGGVAAALLLVGLEGRSDASVARLITLVAAAIAFAVFVREQRRSASPVLAPSLLVEPTVRAGLVAGAFAGALLYSCAAWVPLWTTSRSGTPFLAGVAILPLLVGWAFGSTFGVKILVRHGMRASVAGGFALASVGAVALALAVTLNASTTSVMIALAVLGLGLGPAASTSLVAPQNAVDWSQRGAVTSACYAARALGGSVAVAVLASMPTTLRFDGIAAIALAGLGVLTVLAPAGRPRAAVVVRA